MKSYVKRIMRFGHPELKGTWMVEYFKDTVLSGYSEESNLFAVYYGSREYNLSTGILGQDFTFDEGKLKMHVFGTFNVYRQIFNCAWGAFGWVLNGIDEIFLYDVKIRFIENRLAKVEFTPAKRLTIHHQELITNETPHYGMNDYIIGLLKVNSANNRMWGSTTSIDIHPDRTIDRFVALPYFTARRMPSKKNKRRAGNAYEGSWWSSLSHNQKSIIIAIAALIVATIGAIGNWMKVF